MRIFVAGATGATGQVFIPMAEASTRPPCELVLHVRPQTAPRTPLGQDARARVFDLTEAARLRDTLAGCDAILSLVGTMRGRFQAGDTYESSDVGSTRLLVQGAMAAGVPRFLLLSSAGAGGLGAYMKMKGQCEAIVKDSPLRWTVFRPSALVSPSEGEASHHGRREVPAAVDGLFRFVRRVPGLAGPVDKIRPIPITVLCRSFLRVLDEPRDGAVLSGHDLWELGAEEAN